LDGFRVRKTQEVNIHRIFLHLNHSSFLHLTRIHGIEEIEDIEVYGDESLGGLD